MILEFDHLYALFSGKLNSNSANWCEKRLGKYHVQLTFDN